MKKIQLISLLLLLINASAFSQNENIQSFKDIETWSKIMQDSLHLELSRADNDSSKLQAFMNLWLHYYEYNVDSSIFYLDNMIELARQQGYRSTEGNLYLSKGFMYSYKGEYQKSLEYMLRGQSIIEDPKTSIDQRARITFPNKTDDEIRMIQKSSVKRYLGSLFLRVGNYQISLSNLKEATKGYKRFEEVDDLFYAKLNTARVYLGLNELDSALVTINESLRLDISDIAYNWLGTALTIKASILFKQNKYKEAEITYLKALEINLSNLNYNAAASDQNGLAELYLLTNRPDQGKSYAFDAIQIAKIFNAQDEIANSYELISRSYAAQNSMDSAYHYLHLANELKDSLQNIEKENIRKFNATLLNENLRNKDLIAEKEAMQSRRRTYGLIAALFVFFIIAFLLYRNNRQKQKANTQLERQKGKVERQKQEVENTLSKLKSTQSQLIQSEKMASLGELTAGIAHEIQNPLNFVNNFSEVSTELILEIEEERDKNQESRDEKLVGEILTDVKQNLEKINHHGKRADSIVKGMLQHSRTSSGAKEPTDINALADEYLRLSYHGLRARDKSFNADFKTEFDESLPKINVIPQDIGRVLLNLINNAFYAVDKRAKHPLPPEGGLEERGIKYKPTVLVRTASSKSPSGDLGVKITVMDNGPGIPPEIKDKIFQPFFTTKPTGSGTGLGLSLSYDIVKAHGGEISVESTENEGLPGEQTGTEFIITIPIKS